MKKYAIFSSPIFGLSFGLEDLILYGDDFYNKSYCVKQTYEHLLGNLEVVFL
jgi:hypothetical protein